MKCKLNFKLQISSLKFYTVVNIFTILTIKF